MSNSSLDKAIKLLEIVVASALWYVAAKFSVNGFAFEMNSPDARLTGWILAISISAIEVIGNYHNTRGTKLSFGLSLCWAGSYVYDIGTNIIGIMVYQKTAGVSFMDNPGAYIFPFLLGMGLAIAPEPLFILAITGESIGDFLHHVLAGNTPIHNVSLPGLKPPFVNPNQPPMGFKPPMPMPDMRPGTPPTLADKHHPSDKDGRH